MTPERFRELCKAHDLTFEYSDDHRAWTKGCEQLKEIEAAAKELPFETAKQIWNETVREKILPEHAEEYLWR
jgi:hypothetical protein